MADHFKHLKALGITQWVPKAQLEASDSEAVAVPVFLSAPLPDNALVLVIDDASCLETRRQFIDDVAFACAVFECKAVPALLRSAQGFQSSHQLTAEHAYLCLLNAEPASWPLAQPERQWLWSGLEQVSGKKHLMQCLQQMC